MDETGVPEEKKAIALEGLSYAEQAYTLDANSALCNKWMGIMTGFVIVIGLILSWSGKRDDFVLAIRTVGNFRDLKEKIAGAYVVRVSSKTYLIVVDLAALIFSLFRTTFNVLLSLTQPMPHAIISWVSGVWRSLI